MKVRYDKERKTIIFKADRRAYQSQVEGESLIVEHGELLAQDLEWNVQYSRWDFVLGYREPTDEEVERFRAEREEKKQSRWYRRLWRRIRGDRRLPAARAMGGTK